MNLMHYIEQGGVIMYILLALNIIGFTIMIFKFLQLFITKRKKTSLVETIFTHIQNNNSEAAVTLAKDGIAKKMLHLESGFSTIKTIASIAPLLGLLGTVIGVLSAFEAISRLGLGDPSVFAGGISLALITTVGGLIVAIPHYIGYNYLIGMLDHLEADLNSSAHQKIYGHTVV